MTSAFYFWPYLKESWPNASLGITFPATPVASTYLLLHVGAVQHHLTNPGNLEIIGYFQVCPVSDAGTLAKPELVEQVINLRQAALLIPGTRWLPNGLLPSTGLPVYSAQRTLQLGANPTRVRRLATLPVPDAIVPRTLRASLRNVRCVVHTAGDETVLIPYFELLRVFYYEAGGALVDFFGSRVPLERVCWPIAAPNATTKFVGHFCVAAQLTHPHQARVLAELLFNPAYRATIRRVHATLALDWRAAAGRQLHPQAHFKAPFHLGRAVSVEAHGTSFTVNGQAFFWVSRLVPTSNWFGFSAVVYHPLERERTIERDLKRVYIPFMPLPAFTDVLHSHRKTAYKNEISLKHWPGDKRPRLFPHTPYLPPVHCSFPWARRLLANVPPVYADEAASGYLWEPSPQATGRTKSCFPRLSAFQALIRCFKQDGCGVQQLEINNPGRRLGQGYSALPYIAPPTPTTHSDDRRQWPVSFVHIERGGGHFYVLQVANSDAVLLACWEDLSVWTAEDCDDLLADAAKVPLSWGQRMMRFNGSNGLRVLTYTHKGAGPAVVANWCFQHMRAIIADRNLWSHVAAHAHAWLSLRTAKEQISWWHWWQTHCHDRIARYAGNYLGETPLPGFDPMLDSQDRWQFHNKVKFVYYST